MAMTPWTDRPSAFVVAVINDEQSDLRWLEYVLESHNYAVRRFSSGTALLDSGRLAEIDCLISDIDTSGTDAIRLLGEIQAIHPALPTILITGYPEKLQRLPPLGGIYPGLFTKPFQAEELLAAVADIVRTRTP
jgi:DNA-binding NtrC family response regulator